MTKPPFVSVIIPVLDDQKRLDRCLMALEKQTYPGDRFELVVVDNNSREPIRVPHERGRVIVADGGSYAARNAGVRVAKGEIFAFTDADCLPQPRWLEDGVFRLLSDRQCGLVGGAIDLFCADDQHPTTAETFELLKGFPQQRFVERDHFAATANVFTTRAVFEKVGGFDAWLQSAGDVDFGQRVHAAGYHLVYAPEARVRHPARASMTQLLQKIVRTEVGLKQLAKARGRRHPEYPRYLVPLRWMYIPIAVALGVQKLPRQRMKAAAAIAAVEIVQATTRELVHRGVEIDLRRFWGT